MCLWSASEGETRRARLGETLVVCHRDDHKVAVPMVREGNELCACLKTGDLVGFSNLPTSFQNRFAVPASAVARFLEGGIICSNRDRFDRFDFQNTNVVPMAEIPTGTSFRPLVLVDQLRLPQPVAVETEPDEDDGPDISLPVGIHANLNKVTAGIGAGAILCGFAVILSALL